MGKVLTSQSLKSSGLNIENGDIVLDEDSRFIWTDDEGDEYELFQELKTLQNGVASFNRYYGGLPTYVHYLKFNCSDSTIIQYSPSAQVCVLGFSTLWTTKLATGAAWNTYFYTGWNTMVSLSSFASQYTGIDAYRYPVEDVSFTFGYTPVGGISMRILNPNKAYASITTQFFKGSDCYLSSDTILGVLGKG